MFKSSRAFYKSADVGSIAPPSYEGLGLAGPIHARAAAAIDPERQMEICATLGPGIQSPWVAKFAYPYVVPGTAGDVAQPFALVVDTIQNPPLVYVAFKDAATNNYYPTEVVPWSNYATIAANFDTMAMFGVKVTSMPATKTLTLTSMGGIQHAAWVPRQFITLGATDLEGLRIPGRYVRTSVSLDKTVTVRAPANGLSFESVTGSDQYAESENYERTITVAPADAPNPEPNAGWLGVATASFAVGNLVWSAQTVSANALSPYVLTLPEGYMGSATLSGMLNLAADTTMNVEFVYASCDEDGTVVETLVVEAFDTYSGPVSFTATTPASPPLGYLREVNLRNKSGNTIILGDSSVVTLQLPYLTSEGQSRLVISYENMSSATLLSWQGSLSLTAKPLLATLKLVPCVYGVDDNRLAGFLGAFPYIVVNDEDSTAGRFLESASRMDAVHSLSWGDIWGGIKKIAAPVLGIAGAAIPGVGGALARAAMPLFSMDPSRAQLRRHHVKAMGPARYASAGADTRELMKLALQFQILSTRDIDHAALDDAEHCDTESTAPPARKLVVTNAESPVLRRRPSGGPVKAMSFRGPPFPAPGTGAAAGLSETMTTVDLNWFRSKTGRRVPASSTRYSPESTDVEDWEKAQKLRERFSRAKPTRPVKSMDSAEETEFQRRCVSDLSRDVTGAAISGAVTVVPDANALAASLFLLESPDPRVDVDNNFRAVNGKSYLNQLTGFQTMLPPLAKLSLQRYMVLDDSDPSDLFGYMKGIVVSEKPINTEYQRVEYHGGSVVYVTNCLVVPAQQKLAGYFGLLAMGEDCYVSLTPDLVPTGEIDDEQIAGFDSMEELVGSLAQGHVQGLRLVEQTQEGKSFTLAAARLGYLTFGTCLGESTPWWPAVGPVGGFSAKLEAMEPYVRVCTEPVYISSWQDIPEAFPKYVTLTPVPTVASIHTHYMRERKSTAKPASTAPIIVREKGKYAAPKAKAKLTQEEIAAAEEAKRDEMYDALTGFLDRHHNAVTYLEALESWGEAVTNEWGNIATGPAAGVEAVAKSAVNMDPTSGVAASQAKFERKINGYRTNWNQKVSAMAGAKPKRGPQTKEQQRAEAKRDALTRSAVGKRGARAAGAAGRGAGGGHPMAYESD